MTRRFGRSKSNQSEVGWISTTDIFVFGTCFLLLISVAAIKNRDVVKQELLTRSTELDQTRTKLKETGANLELATEQIADIKNQLLLKQQESEDTKRQLVLESSSVKPLQEDLRQAKLEIESSKRQLAEIVETERKKLEELTKNQRQLNNELVGLGGRLEKVVIMVDVSQSMNEKNNWEPALEIIERWILNLDVGSAAFVLFGDTANLEIPMQTLDDRSRLQIVASVRNVVPSATSTNFHDAFRMAYGIDGVDTIIAFSDGLPSVGVNGKPITSDDEDNLERVLEVHSEILKMAENHPNVTVNAIGLGNRVYTKETGNLLNELALKTGGIFLAVPSKANHGD